MSNNIRLVTTRLENAGKRGELKADSNGYYQVVLGGLNIYNSVGEYYTAQGATELFQKQSDLMRRLTNGNLYGECGHPKPLPGQSEDDYLRRVMYVEETNYSHHISNIELDPNFGKKNPEFKNPDIIGIIGWVKPFGAKGGQLEAALNNPKQNVNFSIRALSRNSYRGGTTIRTLEHILTWDWVTEPGLAVANKWNSPVLESYVDHVLTERVLNRIIESTPECAAMESSKAMAKAAMGCIQQDKPVVKSKAHLYTNW